MQLTRISHRLTVEARDEKCGPRALLKTITPAKTLLLLACCLWACSPSYPPAPETTEQEVVETLHGVEFRDPFRWLEDQNNEQTRFWIDRQNAYAELIIGQSPLRDAVHQRLKELMDLDDARSTKRAGDFEYFSLRRRGQFVSTRRKNMKPSSTRTFSVKTSAFASPSAHCRRTANGWSTAAEQAGKTKLNCAYAT